MRPSNAAIAFCIEVYFLYSIEKCNFFALGETVNNCFATTDYKVDV